jgi:hypothetical protein
VRPERDRALGISNPALCLLLIEFGQKTVKLLSTALLSGTNTVIADVRSLIDPLLIASLFLS